MAKNDDFYMPQIMKNIEYPKPGYSVIEAFKNQPTLLEKKPQIINSGWLTGWHHYFKHTNHAENSSTKPATQSDEGNLVSAAYFFTLIIQIYGFW